MFLADTHIHIYACHSAADLITGAVSRLRTAAGHPDAPCLLTLTETSRDHAFETIKNGSHPTLQNAEVIPTQEEAAIRIRLAELDCTLLAGRQIVTRERLELLALGTTQTFEDGLPIYEAFRCIQESGAVPVLAWAPGKWLGKRASVVQECITACGQDLWLGDSSLRAKGWPTPGPFRLSHRPVLAGSDPLPLPGEEQQAGTYGLMLQTDFNPDMPFASFKAAISGDPDQVRPLGNRNSAVGMFRRLAAHHRHKGEPSG